MARNDELLVLVQGLDYQEYSLETHKDERLKIFHEAKADGIAHALNFLGVNAQGRYIARMDQDDVCLRSRFVRQIRHLEKHNLDFVFSNAVLFGKQIRPFGIMPQPPISLSPKEIRMLLPVKNPLVHPTMLARRSSLESLGFYRRSEAEDYDLWLRAATQGYSIGRTAGFAILYRVHPSQFSQLPKFQMRVSEDSSVNESRQQLIKSMQEEGLISDQVAIEPQVMNLLRSSNWLLYLLWSGIGKRILKIANRLIGKTE